MVDNWGGGVANIYIYICIDVSYNPIELLQKPLNCTYLDPVPDKQTQATCIEPKEIEKMLTSETFVQATFQSHMV